MSSGSARKSCTIKQRVSAIRAEVSSETSKQLLPLPCAMNDADNFNVRTNGPIQDKIISDGRHPQVWTYVWPGSSHAWHFGNMTASHMDVIQPFSCCGGIIFCNVQNNPLYIGLR